MMEPMGQDMGNTIGMQACRDRVAGQRGLHGGGWPRRSHGYCRPYEERSDVDGQGRESLFRKSPGHRDGEKILRPRLPAIVNSNRLPGRKMSPGPHKKPLRGLHRQIRDSPENLPFAEKCDGVHGHFVPFVGECAHAVGERTYGGFKNGKDHCRI